MSDPVIIMHTASGSTYRFVGAHRRFNHYVAERAVISRESGHPLGEREVLPGPIAVLPIEQDDDRPHGDAGKVVVISPLGEICTSRVVRTEVF